MTITELYNYIKKSLATQFCDINERGIVSRRIVGHLSGKGKDGVMLYPDFDVDTNYDAVDNIIRRVEAGEPLEYIFNSAQFLDLELRVNSNVLIPRPETEELAILILNYLKQWGRGGAPLLLDIGTGSGCIPIYLSSNYPCCSYYACDISEEALSTARENADRYNCKINFLQADILNAQLYSELDMLRCDVIVSNPPYVLDSEKQYMQRNVLGYEPHLALFVPDTDPLKFYREICRYAVSHLNKNGHLYFEINEHLGKETATLLENCGFESVEIIKDLFGKDRFVVGVWNRAF